MATETDRSTALADEHTLDAAIGEFRTHGYIGTSVQRLVDATGRSRSSLYNRFGDKDGLFVAGLERYLDTMCPVGEGQTTTVQLRRSIQSLEVDHKLRPCLLVRSCIELPALPDAAREMVITTLERHWNAMVDSPSSRGDVDKGTLALAMRYGLAVLVAAGVPRDVLDRAVDSFA